MRDDPLLRWQWRGYGRNHQDPRNLLLHLFAVPLFMAGTLAVLAGALQASPLLAGAGVAAALGSLALQGRGHRLEQHAPEPFDGAGDALARILAEQWITFPRYLLSGGWQEAWRARRPQPGAAD